VTDVLIVGAGIGGLTAALALHRVGVACNGLHSVVRAHLHPGEGPPVGSGIMMWRGTAPGAPYLTGHSMIMAGRNSTAKFVAYPISPTVDGVVRIN